MVVRIMLMVPIYAAFVIYCFFQLLLGYLGGERSLLILVHGRPPKLSPFPLNVFQRELDISDPYTFLFLKRGILQYVQVKPLLAMASLALKASGKFNEGEFRIDSGYLYVSIVYNASICLSLYCLAMFWLSISEDLKPFRPMPKFLCVKGILFFSFWQAAGVSLLASIGAIKKLGPYTDKEHISLGLTDTLICFEMPFFAIAHLVAFSHRDYVDKKLAYVGRMPMRHALRDAFGFKDVLEDARVTLNGRGMDYREFEPSDGHMHQGLGRERRIRAGLRYSRGGQGKYWIPQPAGPSRLERPPEDGVHVPLLSERADDVVPDVCIAREGEHSNVGFTLPFGDPDSEDEELFTNSRQFFSELARAEMWEEEERFLSNERSAWFFDHQGRRSLAITGYGAVGVWRSQQNRSHTPSKSHAPSLVAGLELDGEAVDDRASVLISTGHGRVGFAARRDAVDLVVESRDATETAGEREGQQGDPDTTRQVGSSGREAATEVRERSEGGSSSIRFVASRGIEEETSTERASGAGVEAVGLVTVETPLHHAHARWKGLMSHYDDVVEVENDENPWA
ncbi:organic solute transporter Ostalpha-domain-containing protein [Multifurca ochricompacta]|uniref:Organic solute transporter Ostalpha-domain-containing protein n=1 Tax=Multifurca ochricompacta TaxID=376703 RepID=A0AAD4M3H7_9AGAM|nr:organic solute transporter Ostalpha-domain-containing protein [Multifurca ochricompacta]